MRYFTVMLMFAGLCSLLGGVFAILNPLTATVAAVTLAAAVLIMSGVAQILGAFHEPDWRSRLPPLLLALAVLALGVAVLRHPGVGIAALTLLMALLFLVSGTAKLTWGWAHRGDQSFPPLMISGLLSLLLAYLVYRNVTSGRSDILGTFLGVELMLNGIALIAVGGAGKRLAERLREA